MHDHHKHVHLLHALYLNKFLPNLFVCPIRNSSNSTFMFVTFEITTGILVPLVNISVKLGSMDIRFDRSTSIFISNCNNCLAIWMEQQVCWNCLDGQSTCPKRICSLNTSTRPCKPSGRSCFAQNELLCSYFNLMHWDSPVMMDE